jgi:hypothetical protein
MGNDYAKFTYDDALALKDAGLVVTSATTYEGTILDLGPGVFDGFLVLDVSAVEVGNSDERFYLSLEASTVAAMTSACVPLCTKVFGQLIVPMDAACSTAGRYVIPIRNTEAGTLFRYVRLFINGTGTIGTGINFSAFLAKR